MTSFLAGKPVVRLFADHPAQPGGCLADDLRVTCVQRVSHRSKELADRIEVHQLPQLPVLTHGSVCPVIRSSTGSLAGLLDGLAPGVVTVRAALAVRLGPASLAQHHSLTASAAGQGRGAPGSGHAIYGKPCRANLSRKEALAIARFARVIIGTRLNAGAPAIRARRAGCIPPFITGLIVISLASLARARPEFAFSCAAAG